MKRLLLILLVLLPFLVRGQNASWRFFDRYTKAEGFTSIQLERKMMRMMSRQAAEKGDRGLAELLGGIEYIRIVSLDKGDGAQFVADAERLAADPDLEFQLVMSGTEEGRGEHLRQVRPQAGCTPLDDPAEKIALYLLVAKGTQKHGLKKPVLWAVAGFHADYPVLRSRSLLYPSKKGPDILRPALGIIAVGGS